MESYIKHGDCLEVMKDIPDKSIDMILCELPYGTTQKIMQLLFCLAQSRSQAA